MAYIMTLSKIRTRDPKIRDQGRRDPRTKDLGTLNPEPRILESGPKTWDAVKLRKLLLIK